MFLSLEKSKKIKAKLKIQPNGDLILASSPLPSFQTPLALGVDDWAYRKGRSDRGRSLIDPYKDYFLERWNTGCHEAKQLFQELQKIGYRGSYPTVARYAKRLRIAQVIKPRQKYPSCQLKIIVDDHKLP